ncbi:MAG TPA: ATP-binding protein [Candidatus Dormibacteraeota bacterium]|nr:ATP-binding protein [Candidatus Dormibacteraeota bacterium]
MDLGAQEQPENPRDPQSPITGSAVEGRGIFEHGEPQARAKTYSLTRRIITAIVVVQLLLVAGLVGVAVNYARTELRSTFNTALDGDAMGALALLRYDEDPPHALTFDFSLLPPAPDPQHPPLFEIRRPGGQAIVRSSGWHSVPDAIARSRQRYLDFDYGGAPYRAVIFRNTPVLDSEEGTPVERVTVFYASSLEEDQLRLTRLSIYVGLTGLLLLLAANSIAIWSIRRGLYPLRELALQASAISVHNWNFRPSSGPRLARELSPLVQAIETVLERLKKSFRQQRDFTNDAAHELKTSVAIVKSTLQSLLHRPRTQREYEIGLGGLLEDCARLEDLLARMLRLARIEQLQQDGITRTKLGTTELSSTCEAAISRIASLAEGRNIRLVFEDSPSVYMLADPEDLELIWLNLLENAVQHSPPGSQVQMRVQLVGAGHARISVMDSGPGIPPGELPHIFERFHRGDPSRARTTGGFGLGLAICKTLVDAYDGSIEAINRPAEGTEMRVDLPIVLN